MDVCWFKLASSPTVCTAWQFKRDIYCTICANIMKHCKWNIPLAQPDVRRSSGFMCEDLASQTKTMYSVHVHVCNCNWKEQLIRATTMQTTCSIVHKDLHIYLSIIGILLHYAPYTIQSPFGILNYCNSRFFVAKMFSFRVLVSLIYHLWGTGRQVCSICGIKWCHDKVNLCINVF